MRAQRGRSSRPRTGTCRRRPAPHRCAPRPHRLSLPASRRGPAVDRRAAYRSPRRLIAPPARAQGEKSNCIDSANNVAYLLNPTDHKVYSYDFSGLQTGGKGYKSSGTPAGSYVYYLNLNKKIATVPAATCDGAESSCGAQGCAAFQTTPDGGECYAVGDAGSVAATFFDPSVNKAGTPQDGVTLVMSSGGGAPAPARHRGPAHL